MSPFGTVPFLPRGPAATYIPLSQALYRIAAQQAEHVAVSS